ncbi:MAG: SpoIIE family protein phosphatase, partial [Aliifodinibius sp.]|nr:SpoIIE family protein phosphatase [Fodinibius sp.]NIV11545.1 SpoIIE family protein phosphatase [Fodinibius sp.]NIY25142.1 SpoIIE family protein phosphatase [Fodinibius sp.]
EYDTLKAIFDNVGEGVIVANKDGNFILFNSAAEKILGVGPKDIPIADWMSVYGCYYEDKITPFPSENLPLARALRGESISGEIIFIKNQERPAGIYILVSSWPIRDKNGVISHAIVIIRDMTDSKRDAEKLKHSEERLKAQFKGLNTPTYVWQHTDNDFILVDYNDAAEVLTEGNIKKFLGIKLSKMYPNMWDEIPTDIWRCFNEKKIVDRQMTYQFQSNGKIKDLDVRYIYIPPDIVLAHTEDVTASKEAEKELRKLSNAVEQTADAIIICRKNGVIEYANQAIEKMTDYRIEEIIGQTPRIFKSGHHNRNFYRKLWNTILSGKPFKSTIANKKKNGELYWVQNTITPMKDPEGNITSFVSVMKDITELKRQQERELLLNVASEIQQGLYNSNISIPGFDIAGANYPADATSGDYYDIIPTQDGHFWIAMGDVCGHGIGSALIMAETRAYLRAFTKTESDPGKVLTLLNEELVADLNPYHYVTLILAKIDTNRHVLEYAGAGHVPAFVLNASGEVVNVLRSEGIPLGFKSGELFHKNESIEITPNNILVFLTDGVTEAHTTDFKEFGAKRAISVIKRYRQSDSSEIIKHLYTEIRRFIHNNQDDDITALLCKVSQF